MLPGLIVPRGPGGCPCCVYPGPFSEAMALGTSVWRPMIGTPSNGRLVGRSIPEVAGRRGKRCSTDLGVMGRSEKISCLAFPTESTPPTTSLLPWLGGRDLTGDCMARSASSTETGLGGFGGSPGLGLLLGLVPKSVFDGCDFRGFGLLAVSIGEVKSPKGPSAVPML